MMKDRSQLVSYLAREEIECEVVYNKKKKRQNVRNQKHKAFTSQQNRVIFFFYPLPSLVEHFPGQARPTSTLLAS